MNIKKRKKLQDHFWKLVESTEVKRMRYLRYKEVDKAEYIESQALEDGTKETIKLILGEAYYYKFFHNQSIDVRNKTFDKMLKKLHGYE
jgi:hypothetical protein